MEDHQFYTGASSMAVHTSDSHSGYSSVVANGRQGSTLYDHLATGNVDNRYSLWSMNDLNHNDNGVDSLFNYVSSDVPWSQNTPDVPPVSMASVGGILTQSHEGLQQTDYSRKRNATNDNMIQDMNKEQIKKRLKQESHHVPTRMDNSHIGIHGFSSSPTPIKLEIPHVNANTSLSAALNTPSLSVALNSPILSQSKPYSGLAGNNPQQSNNGNAQSNHIASGNPLNGTSNQNMVGNSRSVNSNSIHSNDTRYRSPPNSAGIVNKEKINMPNLSSISSVVRCANASQMNMSSLSSPKPNNMSSQHVGSTCPRTASIRKPPKDFNTLYYQLLLYVRQHAGPAKS